jgi:predicted alpha/beta superfamily hydrolase
MTRTTKGGITMPAITLLFSLIFCGAAKSQVVDSAHLTGAEIKTFYSRILGENRKIRIQIPPGMNEFDSYPVLYLLDGEVQMNMVAGQVQYLSEAYKIIPNLIVVGIDNTDRNRDLTPTHSIIGRDGKPDSSANGPWKNSGGGERFLQFLREELVPYINQHYRTVPFRILAGHSLGGLMAIYCIAHHPEDFNAYIAISPSLQWDNNYLLKELETSAIPKKTGKRILFFSDANEDEAFHRNQLTLDSLLATYKVEDLKWKRQFYPEETHISEPVKAFYDGIRFLYPAWHLAYSSSAFRATMTSKIIKDHYASLSKEYGYNVIPLHDELNQISRFLANDAARLKDAIELLQMNRQNYPASPVVAELLGDTWMKAGNSTKAIAAYKEALHLNPSSPVVNKKINELEKQNKAQ